MKRPSSALLALQASAIVLLLPAFVQSFSVRSSFSPLARRSAAALVVGAPSTATVPQPFRRLASVPTEDDEPEPEIPDEPKVEVRCPDCDLCDGSGRILGGIGTVLDWWPIKAYRPCPNFIDRGGKYVRSGQGLDEIAFGRDSTFQSDS
ncbi:hypothetical protein ACHAWF_013544 [Thalassiosira exigua]